MPHSNWPNLHYADRFSIKFTLRIFYLLSFLIFLFRVKIKCCKSNSRNILTSFRWSCGNICLKNKKNKMFFLNLIGSGFAIHNLKSNLFSDYNSHSNSWSHTFLNADHHHHNMAFFTERFGNYFELFVESLPPRIRSVRNNQMTVAWLAKFFSVNKFWYSLKSKVHLKGYKNIKYSRSIKHWVV